MRSNLQALHENEIILLKGISNYTEFYLSNGKREISSFTLKHHQQAGFSHFIRVSKSHLLNPKYIKEIHSVGLEKEVELRDGDRVKVSRRRRDVLNFIFS
jgi:DNA-binding LytR/AlgR family response regulator